MGLRTKILKYRNTRRPIIREDPTLLSRQHPQTVYNFKTNIQTTVIFLEKDRLRISDNPPLHEQMMTPSVSTKGATNSH